MSDALKEILNLPIDSAEWDEVYHKVHDRHWNTEPAVKDDYFRSAKFLNLLANRDVPDLIIATSKIAEQVFEIVEKGTECVTAEIHVGDHKLFFRISKSMDAIDRLQKQLSNTVIVKAKDI